MRTLAVLVSILFFNFLSAQQTSEEKGNISVSITNISSEEGQVMVALYSQENFLKEPNFSEIVKIENGMAKATFTNVPKGTYAVVALHDKNGNKRMDFESNGMPKEDYGTSGDSFTYGPPQWEDSKFDFYDMATEINIRF